MSFFFVAYFPGVLSLCTVIEGLARSLWHQIQPADDALLQALVGFMA